MPSQFVKKHRAYAFPALVFLVLSVTAATSDTLLIHRYFQDMFVVLDAMWRAALGQTPHIDFPSSIGQAYYWPFAILAGLGDVSVTTLLRANVLVAGFVGVLCYLTLPRRLGPWSFAIATLTMVTIAMTPRDLDGWIQSFSFLAPYNTWAWAIVGVPALVTLVPPRTPSGFLAKGIDGIVLGLALGVLYYLKITFFVPAVAFVVLGLLLRHTGFVAVAVAIAIGALMVLGVEATAHNNGAYLADIQTAVQVNLEGPRGVRPGKIIKNVALGLAVGGFFLAGLWAFRPSRRPVEWFLGNWRAIAVAAFIIGGGSLIATQNHPKFQLTLASLGLLAGAEIARRRSDAAPGSGAGLSHWALPALAIVAAMPAAVDSASIIAQRIDSQSVEACRIPALAGITDGIRVQRLAPRAKGAPIGPKDCSWIAASAPQPYIEPGVPNAEWRSTNMIQRLDEGVRLLNAHRSPTDTVMVGAFSNPYPMLFKTRPPEGALIWWDHDRTFSTTIHPPSERILRSSTIVLQALDDFEEKRFWPVYGPDVERQYVLVDQTPRWKLWIRRGQPNAIPMAKAP